MSKKDKRLKYQKHHKKKGLLLFTLLPIASLGIAGGVTVGVLYGSGIIGASKTDISTIFSADTGHWANNVNATGAAAPLPDIGSGVGTGAGYIWKSAISESTISENEIIGYLGIFASTLSDGNQYVTNDLTVSNLTSLANSQWYKCIISVETSSRKWEGTFNFYFYTDFQARNLAADFTNKAITYSTTSSPIATNSSISYANWLAALALENTNLDTNAIHIQYSTDTTIATPIWTEWAEEDTNTHVWTTSRTFGAYASNATDKTTSLSLWNATDNCYGKAASGSSSTSKAGLRIVPTAENPVYSGQDPIQFTIQLYRPELKDNTDWTSAKTTWATSNNNQFRVTPSGDNLNTRFAKLFTSNTTFYQGCMDNTYLESWNFVTDANKGVLTINGNPFYNSQTNTTVATTDAGYQFEWTLLSPVDVNEVIISAPSTPITNLNNKFYRTPNRNDVITVLKGVIDSSVLSSIVWNQIDIDIDAAGIISLSGITGSLYYTTAEQIINYTLIS